jgi:hypothetical protein
VTRTEDTITLDDLLTAVCDNGDLEAECMTRLGLHDRSAIADDWSGTPAQKWGLSRTDLRRPVRLTRDSLGRIDSESVISFDD